MKQKFMDISCPQLTLHPIVRVLRKSAHVTKNAKNASNITQKKAKTPTVQDNQKQNIPED